MLILIHIRHKFNYHASPFCSNTYMKGLKCALFRVEEDRAQVDFQLTLVKLSSFHK